MILRIKNKCSRGLTDELKNIGCKVVRIERGGRNFINTSNGTAGRDGYRTLRFDDNLLERVKRLAFADKFFNAKIMKENGTVVAVANPTHDAYWARQRPTLVNVAPAPRRDSCGYILR